MCSVAYTIVSDLAAVEIEVVASADLKAKVVKSTRTTGTIDVTAGETIDEESHVLVFVSNGEKTLMKKLVIVSDTKDGQGDDDDDGDPAEGSGEIPADMTLAFPDPIFRQYVLDNFDTDKDGKISQAEALEVEMVEVGKYLSTADNEKIATLEGVQYFTNLTYWYCSHNKLTELDVSKTNLGNSQESRPLVCAYMPTLQTLTLKTGWSIPGITEDNGRSTLYIPAATRIVYVN